MHLEARRRRLTTMTCDFMSVAFTWLFLSSSAALAYGQDDSFTEGTTAQNQVTTAESASSNAPLTVLRSNPTRLTLAEGNLTEVTDVQTTTPRIPSIMTQTTTTSTDTTSAGMNTSTVTMSITEEPTVGKSTIMDGTSQVSNSTEFTMIPSKLSSTPHNFDTGKTSTIGVARSKTPGTSARQSEATSIAYTSEASSITEEGKSDGTSPATSSGGGLTQSTAPDQTSTVRASISITKPKKRTNPQGEKDKPNTGTGHSKVVAGLIGGALLAMMAGFLVIFFKKRRLQKRKFTTKDWAGPSPFIESGSNNGDMEQRSSNRISVSSFLPQRLSKRLSLLPEADEEMEDMTATITFGSKRLEKNGKKVDGNGKQDRNELSVVVSDVKSTSESTEAGETSYQTTHTQSTNNNSEVSTLNQKQSDNQTDLSEDGEKNDSTN